jgi:uncharacterized protein
MKTLIPVMLILVLSSCQKDTFSPDLTRDFSILSTTNGAKYNIKVALPQNYNPETQKYATIYVLDGDENFSYVAEKCQNISHDFDAANVLVVAIGYGNDRAVDYTPVEGGGGAVKGGGGAEKFMLFIKNELIPKMENEYGADSSRMSRTILGHSFGGLFGAYAFADHNEVFGNYLLLSPSLWYANEIVFKLEQENRNNNKNNPQLVFLGLGEMENSGQMLAPFKAFYQLLENNYPKLEISSHIEPHLNHMGSKKPNIVEALNFYFENRSY